MRHKIDLNFIQNAQQIVEEIPIFPTVTEDAPIGEPLNSCLEVEKTQAFCKITSFEGFEAADPVMEIKRYWHLISPDMALSFDGFFEKSPNLALLFDYGHWMGVNEPNYAANGYGISNDGITICKSQTKTVYKMFQHLKCKYFSAELHKYAVELQLWLWVVALELFVERSQREFDFFTDCIAASDSLQHLELVSIGIKVFAGHQVEDRDRYMGRLRTVFTNRMNVMKGQVAA